MNEEDHLNSIDMLLKSRNEKKKEEYLKRLKDKKNTKKKEKKEKGKDLNLKEQRQKIDYSELDKLLKEENTEIEYIEEDISSKPFFFSDFKSVFEYFIVPKKEEKKNDSDSETEKEINDDNEDLDLQENTDFKPISKKKQKLQKRIKISELKQTTNKPEVVEAWDITSKDPILLVYLKSMKNTVSVPKHWSQKRKFLQNKRGFLKPPFKLPDFIENTGIMKIRDTSVKDRQSLKLEAMKRMQPKLGKMDIDYQTLYDAFFKHQTKSSLSIHGDIYYENKENETKMKIYTPGRISERLRTALSINEKSPPPWIMNMQRYGPPPSYPNLKIPGVNADILDPTAEITPHLWTEPDLVSNFKPVFYNAIKGNTTEAHWGDLKENDFEDNNSDIVDDMSLSDNNDNKTNLDSLFKDANNIEDDYVSGALKEGEVPNPNLHPNFTNPLKNNKDFYTILEQTKKDLNSKEIISSNYGYIIPKNEDNKE